MKKFRFLLMWSLLLMAALRLRTGLADAYYVVEINTGTVTGMDEGDLSNIEIRAVNTRGEGYDLHLGLDVLNVSDSALLRCYYMGLSSSTEGKSKVKYIHGDLSHTTIYAVLVNQDGVIATSDLIGEIESFQSVTFTNLTAENSKYFEIHSLQIYDMGEYNENNERYDNADVISQDFELDRLGYFSNQPMLSFEGERVAYLAYADQYDVIYEISEKNVEQFSVGFSWKLSTLTNVFVGSNTKIALLNEKEHYKTDNTYYYLELQFADILGAGVESVNFGGTTAKNIEEALQLNVKYMDAHGGIHEICIPLLTSAAAFALQYSGTDLYEQDKTKFQFFTLAQQGGRVVVPLWISDFSCFIGTPTINLLGENAACALDENHKQKLNASAKKVANETVLLSGVLLSKGRDGVHSLEVTDAYVNGCSLDYFYQETIAVQYFHDDKNPIEISAKTVGKLNMPFEGAPTSCGFMNSDYRVFRGGQYLVEIRTADIANADTLAETYVEITYLNSYGREVSTEKIKISDAIKEYNGHLDDTVSKVMYMAEVSRGGVVRFFLDLEDVKSFTSATFSIDGKDTWIISDFNIYTVEKASEPIYLLVKGPGWDSPRLITYRKINGSLPLAFSSVYFYHIETFGRYTDARKSITMYDGTSYRLVNVGAQENMGGDSSAGIYIDSTKTVSFISKEITGHADKGLFQAYYSLNYSEACVTRDFVDNVYQYNVRVKVASDVYNAAGDDDSGSTNFFYFKLVFESGESAYVQANQQLDGDAFRAKQEACFTINLNHNYGDLKSIKIIPENDVDKGSPYDKLNIEYIIVSMSDSEGHVKTWTFTGSDGTGIGWVGIDYSDAAKQTHSEAEIAKVCGITSYGIGINLLFVLTTDQNGSASGTSGTVLADVVYRKASTGKSETITVDVIKSIRDFNNDLGYEANKIGVPGDGGQFRAGHSDRFLLPMTDIDRIESISFYGFSDNNEQIPISAISVYVVNQGSIRTDRTVNYDGEYIIQDCKKTRVASIAPGDYSEGSNIVLLGSYKEAMKRSATFIFKNGTANIMGSNDEKSTIYTVTETPLDGLDNVNIVVNTMEYEYVSGQNISAQLEYKTIYGTTMLASTTLIYIGTDNNGYAIFARYGVPLKNFATLRNLTIKANGTTKISVRRISIQHLREKALVGTYNGIFTTYSDAREGITCKSFEKNSSSEKVQKIYIELDNSIEETLLIAKDHDIAVSLGVKTVSENGVLYDTPYTFVTGGEPSLKILPGGILEITTKEVDVQELDYIRIAATGNLSITIKRIAVGLYNYDQCIRWYSYEDTTNGPTTITNETQKIYFSNDNKSTSNTVNVLDFTFETMDASTKYGDAGTHSAIGMEITYFDADCRYDRTWFVSDLNNYLVEGSFEQGATARVRILARGINSTNIKSVRLIPYDSNDLKNPESFEKIYNAATGVSNLTWGLKSIRIDFNDGEDLTIPNAKSRIMIPVQKVIAARDTKSISLKNAVLEAIVNYVDPTTGAAAEPEYIVNDTTEITVPYTEGGVDFSVDVSIFDSEKGWVVTQKDKTVYGNITITPQSTENGDSIQSNTYLIHLDGTVENETKKEVIFTSVENTDREIHITFVMSKYVDADGNSPMKVTASNDRGEIQIGYTGQVMEYIMGAEASKLSFTCTSAQEIKPVITVSKVSGEDVTYTVKDSHDGKLEIEFGARGTADTIYSVTMTYTMGGKAYSFLCTVTVKGDAKSTVAKANGAFEFSCKDGNTDIYGVVVGGREDYITLPNKEGLEITYKLNGATGTLEDVTEYHDTEVPVETEPATEPVTEAPSTESPAETEPATEPVTEPSTEPVTEATSTEENASTTEEGTDAQAITEAEGGEGQLQSDSSSSAGATIIPDPNRAVITGSTITLPSGTKTYVFNYNGLFEIKRDK